MAKSKIDWSPQNWPYLLFRLFSSYALAAVVLVFMTLVTLLGTFYQIDNGLYQAKKHYFYSYITDVSVFGKFKVPIPGGMLLMLLLFINMFIGAVVKVRKRWRGVGLLISHIGMLMLLLGGFVTWKYASDGYMALYPGMKSSKVESYREWQLEIMPVSEDNKAEKAIVIPSGALEEVGEEGEKSFTSPELPFQVVVSNFHRNANVIPVSAPISAEAKGKEIDGYKLLGMEPNKSAEQNVPACYVTFSAGADSEPVEAILWGYSSKFDAREKPMPFLFELGGEKYAALLTKKSWSVPFHVQLDEFIFEKHPGITMAKSYMSHVTRLEEGQENKVIEIKMNEPMRYAGFTFFQESYGPPDGKPGEMFSQFAVASNPADKWPIIALTITGLGLLVHFVVKLIEFIGRARRKREKAAEAAAN